MGRSCAVQKVKGQIRDKEIMKNYFLNLAITTRYFGFDVILFIAGIAGGIVFLSKDNKLSPWKKFLSVLSGGLTANYLTPIVGQWLHLSDDTLYGIAFMLGYGGLRSVEAIFIAFINRAKKAE